MSMIIQMTWLNDTAVMQFMRFVLFSYAIVIVLAFPLAVNAQNLITPSQKPGDGYNSPNLIPAEKPTGKNFSKRSRNLIGAGGTRTTHSVRPPSMPSQKKVTSVSVSVSSASAGTHPIIPTRKPLKINTMANNDGKTNVNKGNKGEESDGNVTVSYWGNDDDRTAGKGWRNAQKTSNKSKSHLNETNEKSPFKTARLPRAGQASSNDPVIIFFEEKSSDLEVGQMSVIEGDVLRILKKNPQKKIMIYGFAEEQQGEERTQQLSLNRAMLIAQYLSDNGVRDGRITLRAMGTDTPISPKDRVDVIID